MYEELIKRLRASCEDCKLWDGYRCYLKCDCTAQTRLQAADAIEELEKFYQIMADAYETEVTKERWIPVTERLPEKGIDVLVFAEGKIEGFLGDTVIAISRRYDFKLFTYFEEVEVWQSPWQYFLTDYEITHWMPLPPSPEPPKEETC